MRSKYRFDGNLMKCTPQNREMHSMCSDAVLFCSLALMQIINQIQLLERFTLRKLFYTVVLVVKYDRTYIYYIKPVAYLSG